MSVSRTQVLRYRVHAQQLDRAPRKDRRPDDAALLDLGVAGHRTGRCALGARAARRPRDRAPLAARARARVDRARLRPTPTAAPTCRPSRRRCAPTPRRTPPSASSTPRLLWRTPASPCSTRSRRCPGRCARSSPSRMVKGTLSTRMTAEMPEPYLRWCAGCHATHMYEMPFRLAALHAGLELEPYTSPPVVRRIPRWPASQVGNLERADDSDDGPVDLLRGLLHLLGPVTPKQAAVFLDSTVRDVKARWPRTPSRSTGTVRASSTPTCAALAGSAARAARPAARARTTCSCRDATASSWSPTRPTTRRSGRPSAGPARSSPTGRSSARGDRARRASSSRSSSTSGCRGRAARRPRSGSSTSGSRSSVGVTPA